MDLGKQGKNSSLKASCVQEEHLENIESLTSLSLAFTQGNLLWYQWHLFFWGELRINFKGSPILPEER